MNPLAWSFRTQMLMGAAACLAAVAFAFYSQLAWGLAPCEMCVRQRVAYLLLGGLFLLAGLFAPGSAGWRRVLGTLLGFGALAGASIAARQIWLKFNPSQMPTCRFSFLPMDREPTLWEQFITPTVECGAIEWNFLGLSMPQWSLACLLLLGAWAVLAGLRRR